MVTFECDILGTFLGLKVLSVTVSQCDNIPVGSNCHTQAQKGVDLTSECDIFLECDSVTNFPEMSVTVWQCDKIAVRSTHFTSSKFLPHCLTTFIVIV